MAYHRRNGKSHSTLIGSALLLVGLAVSPALAGPPAVFWASDPVKPGETVMVIGEELGQQPTVELVRLPDATPNGSTSTNDVQRVEVLERSAQSLKFAVPADWKPGVWAYRITTPDGTTSGGLNLPQVWWVQGDQGVEASPGGTIRFFGKNFGPAAPDPASTPLVRLQGPKTLVLRAEGDSFAGKITLPADLPCGTYQLSVHRGLGGEGAWSHACSVAVVQPSPWPQTVFNVKDSGAEGNGLKDDTAAIQTALEKAEQNGGGIVYFPRGRYQLSDGLVVPRFTVLRGEKQALVALCWTDMATLPEALVKGTNSFGLEELTLYANHHHHVIAGDLGDQPEAGNVFLRHVRTRADAYRGHLKPEQVDARMRESLRWSTGGGDTVRLGGENIEITNCDLYGSGRALFLSRTRGGRVSGNRFYNGRWGWYSISGSDGLIFEDNSVTGADLMSTGGGLNCLDGSSYSQNVYYARNRLSLMHGWDREAMTSDAGGEVYFGKLAAVRGSQLTLAGPLTKSRRNPVGSGLFVLNGKGAGQYRRVTGLQEATVEIDRPFTVEPDAESDICITMFQGHYLVVGNEFADSGPMQFYGTSIECLVAGNRGTRMSGFRGLGLWYHGFQPSWFCQFLGNEITEGNYYHWYSATEASIEVRGAKHAPYEGPLNRGAVLRDNRLQSNAHLRVAGTCCDVVVEGNRVQDAEQGVFVSREASNVLVRNNQFQDVAHDVVDEVALRKAAEARLQRYLGRQEPVAVWNFDGLKGTKFADGAGNGFLASYVGDQPVLVEGICDKAMKLDGKSYLRVDEPAVFNAPDVTVTFWLKPASLEGRQGLVSKRMGSTVAPLVITQNGASIGFEATEENGPWTFNFRSPAVFKENEWTHVAVSVKQGEGVKIYANGQLVAEKQNSAARATNDEPLILGRDAWGGNPPKNNTPGFYSGLLDEVKIWTRALTAEEIKADAAASPK